MRPVVKIQGPDGRWIGVFKPDKYEKGYQLKRRAITRGKVFWGWILPLDDRGKPIEWAPAGEYKR